MTPPRDVIRSRANALLKRARLVARGREDGFVLLEGERLVADALRPESPLAVETVLAREDFGGALDGPVHFVSAEAFDGVGALRTTPPVVAIARTPRARGAEELRSLLARTAGDALVVGVAGVADPGNLGALARCAEATGAVALVVAGPDGARPFGAKALRGSMGSLLRVPVFELGDVDAALDALEESGVTSWAAATRGGAPLASAGFAGRDAVWLTGETGDAPAALERCRAVTIPMLGAVESLNVSVAGALLMYEVARRRGERA